MSNLLNEPASKLVNKREENIFLFLLNAMAFSFPLSVSATNLFSSLFILQCLYLFIKNKLYKKLLSASSHKALFLFTVLAYAISLYYFENLNDGSRSLRKLRYLPLALILAPVVEFVSRNIKINFQKLIFRSLVLFGFATLVGEYCRWFNYDISRFEHYDFGRRNPGIVGIFHYGFETGWMALIAFGLLINGKIDQIKSKPFFIFLLTLCSLGVITSNIRSATLSFLLALPFVFYSKYKKIFQLSIGLILSLIISIVIIALNYDFKDAGGPRMLIGKTSKSNLERIELQRQSYFSFLEKPWFGGGLLSNNMRDPKTLKYAKFENGTLNLVDSHNTYAQALTDFGLIGFINYLVFLFLWLSHLYKRNDMVGWILLPAILAFSIGAAFHTMFLTGSTTALMLIVLYAFSFIKVPKEN